MQLILLRMQDFAPNFQNFLGGACPQTPLAGSGRVAALTGDRGGLPGLPKNFSW